jgi:hypothetical protein
MCIAADRRQARVVLRYIVGLLEGVPELAALIARRTAEAIHLSTGISLEVHTASFRAVRGYTILGAVCDELAFWPTDDDAANPDTEILNALRPAMSTVPGALLLCISSPYARRGALWAAYRAYHGAEGAACGPLVWQADTRSMNPTVDPAVIAEAYAQDAAVAAAEYGAEFRRDIETFVSREVIEACVIATRYELPPRRDVEHRAFKDFAGGSGGGGDSDALVIGHAEVRDGRRIAVLDAIREARPPFSPEAIVAEHVALLRTYGITVLTGDRFGGEWPREPFRRHGIEYQVAAKAKSDLYRDVLPALNAGSVELLDHPRLVAQLCGLERRTARGGKDTIDHPPSGRDDVANAACGVIQDLLVRQPGGEGGAVPIRGGVLRFDLMDAYARAADAREWRRRWLA